MIEVARVRYLVLGAGALFLVTVGLAEVSSDPQPTTRSGCTASELRFGRLEEELPGDREALNRFLTERFFNSQESALICPQANWQERSGEFREAILARAGVEGIPADGLEKGFAQIIEERRNYAVVPIGAFRARLEGSEVWVVLVKWEHDMPGAREPLGHIAIHVFDDEGQRITMVQCS